MSAMPKNLQSMRFPIYDLWGFIPAYDLPCFFHWKTMITIANWPPSGFLPTIYALSVIKWNHTEYELVRFIQPIIRLLRDAVWRYRCYMLRDEIRKLSNNNNTLLLTSYAMNMSSIQCGGSSGRAPAAGRGAGRNPACGITQPRQPLQ